MCVSTGKTWNQPSFRPSANKDEGETKATKAHKYYNKRPAGKKERGEASRRARRWPFVSRRFAGKGTVDWTGGEHG